MSKPIIHAYCKAGCKWQTVHYDDFLKSANLINLPLDTEGDYSKLILQIGKKYKIYNSSSARWNIQELSYRFNRHVITSGTVEEQVIDLIAETLPTFDKYERYFYIKILEVVTTSEGTNSVLNIVYEINDNRYTAMYSYNHNTYAIETGTFKVLGAAKVCIVNEDGDTTLDLPTATISLRDSVTNSTALTAVEIEINGETWLLGGVSKAYVDEAIAKAIKSLKEGDS